MKRSHYLIPTILSGILAAPAVAQTSKPAATIGGTQAEALREHLDEAEDLVDTLLQWRHIVTWSDEGKLEAPPPEGPKTTLISIDSQDVRTLTGLLDAILDQVPGSQSNSPTARGDLRAHAEKAQQIARELQPPHAATVDGKKTALVTVDRTTLERLDVELDAIEMLLPRATK